MGLGEGHAAHPMTRPRDKVADKPQQRGTHEDRGRGVSAPSLPGDGAGPVLHRDYRDHDCEPLPKGGRFSPATLRGCDTRYPGRIGLWSRHQPGRRPEARSRFGSKCSPVPHRLSSTVAGERKGPGHTHQKHKSPAVIALDDWSPVLIATPFVTITNVSGLRRAAHEAGDESPRQRPDTGRLLRASRTRVGYCVRPARGSATACVPHEGRLLRASRTRVVLRAPHEGPLQRRR
jgi:hypothetical protein